MVPAATSTVATKAGDFAAGSQHGDEFGLRRGPELIDDNHAGEHGCGRADENGRHLPAPHGAAERDDIAAGLERQGRRGVDAGEDAIEQRAVDRRLARRIGERLEADLPGRDGAAERGIGGIAGLGRTTLVGRQACRAHIRPPGRRDRRGQRPPPRHSFSMMRLRLKIVFTVATGRSNRLASSSRLQP